MTITVALRQVGRRVASVVSLLLVVLLCAASPVAAHHIAGATYEGTHAQGGTVSFTVTPDGTGISSVTVNGTLQGDTCQFTGTTTTYSQPLPITDHAFSDTSPPQTGSGTFGAPQSANGTFRVQTSAGPYSPACDTGDITWNATTRGTTTIGRSPAGDGLRRVGGQLKSTLSNGLTVTVNCPGPCSIVSELQLSGATAKKLGLAAASVVVARGTAKRSQAGTAKVKVKFKSKAKRKLRGLTKVNLKLRTKIKDANGRSDTLTKNVTLRRNLPANRPPSFPTPMQTTSTTQFHYDQSSGFLTGATTTMTVVSLPTDPDGDPLTYSWEATNGSISGNGPTGTWEREISSGQPADGDATVTVRDGRGGSDTFTFRFT